MNEELISVIIPTYKRIDTLERALNSVFNQTYTNIELIVVDDNAKFPETREKVEKIIEKYNGKIKLIKNKDNLGGGLSRNEGIKVASGKYIAFLDDDDEYYPEKLEKQYSLLKEKEKEGEKVGLIYCYATYVYPKTTRLVKKDYEGIPLKEHMIQCIAATSWWLCPKKALLDIGGFENVSSHQDATLILSLLYHNYKIYRVPEVLLNYYVHDGDGITKINNNWINDDIEYREKCRKCMNSLSESDKDVIEYSFSERIANMSIIIGNMKVAKNEIKQLIRIDPISKKTIRIILKLLFKPLYIRVLESKKKRR